MDIELLDHVIIGSPSADPMGLGYYSFSEAGLLPSVTDSQEYVDEMCPEPAIE